MCKRKNTKCVSQREREEHLENFLEDLDNEDEDDISSIVVEGIRTVLFFYQDILHKNKTPKYLNTPKTHNQAHSLGKKCLDKIADKKIINNILFKNKM